MLFFAYSTPMKSAKRLSTHPLYTIFDNLSTAFLLFLQISLKNERIRGVFSIMLGKIFGVFCLVSVIFGAFTGNLSAVASAIPEGAETAVKITLTLLGMMCFWSGVMQVLGDTGAVRYLSRLFSPLLRHIFPNAYRTGQGYEEICATLSANFLGLGNAATPFALSAMQKMHLHNPHPDAADGEEITLAVLSTASLTLVPANLLALRRAAGSSNPFSIMIPVWIASLFTTAFALFLTSFLRIRARFSHIRAAKKYD